MNEPTVCEESHFQTLFTQHIGDVRNFMYYKTGDLDTAEDLAQESFVKMWENCADIIFSKAKSFLFTVANRLFLNTIRHEKVKLNFMKENPIDKQSKSDNPEFLMEEQEFKNKLQDAISALPEIQREVFLMNRIDKMSYNEIAETLNISVKAVEKRMGNCLRTLKENVSELKVFKI